ncbi:MAG: photosystem I reaction center subunit VIII [Cyanobacteria bacterium SW_9_44_58]|nr:MAG: photosystem I reaction center subunit VIII [Cyanobacteria bacterium SW_9_44_58]
MSGDYAASFLPLVLVPAVGLLIPAVTMGLLFIYIESDA